MSVDHYIERHIANEMNRTSLIQRLKKPLTPELDEDRKIAINSMAFGGRAFEGGRIPLEVMKQLVHVFRFDYMGASEFEWGSVPDALQRMFEAREHYEGFTIELPFEDIGEKTSKAIIEDFNAKVYILSHKEESAEVEKRIRAYALDERKERLKEHVGLASALRNSRPESALGWLELNNGYFFTIDETMFKGMLALFGVSQRLL